MIAKPADPATPSERLRLSHEHTAFSAMLLLMVSTLLSRVIGLVRQQSHRLFIRRGLPWPTPTMRPLQLPDMMTCTLLAGGTASITFITILSRYREQGREHEGEEALSVILSVMLLVLGTAVILGEIFAPLYMRIFFPSFDAQIAAALCVHMTRIMLPAQLCFFAGGVLSAVLLVRKQFAWQAVAPLIYSVGIVLGGILLHEALGVSSLAVGALVGAICGPLLLNYFAAHRTGLRLHFSLNWSNPGLRDWVRMSIPLMIGVSAGLGRQLDSELFCLGRPRRYRQTKLRKNAVYHADGHPGTGRWRRFPAVFCRVDRQGQTS